MRQKRKLNVLRGRENGLAITKHHCIKVHLCTAVIACVVTYVYMDTTEPMNYIIKPQLFHTLSDIKE